jgi:hypothetical protein
MGDNCVHPFENDPFATVWEAFHNLWPNAECTIAWDGDIHDEDNEPVWGVTEFVDGDIPQIAINPSLEVWDAVEVLAHELAHVAVGIEAGHGESWWGAFDAIRQEYERIMREEHPDAQFQSKGGFNSKEGIV